jgi:hypothetical protein
MYTTLKCLALQGAPYKYDISRLGVNRNESIPIYLLTTIAFTVFERTRQYKTQPIKRKCNFDTWLTVYDYVSQ